MAADRRTASPPLPNRRRIRWIHAGSTRRRRSSALSSPDLLVDLVFSVVLQAVVE
jgi:hypothetical protein